jgi:hypothetical protein
MIATKSEKLTIFVIATRDYLEFAFSLIWSCEKVQTKYLDVTFRLLTDDEVTARSRLADLGRVKVQVKGIPSYGWPEATLLRFELMCQMWPENSGGLVAYMDADMQFVSDFSLDDMTDEMNSCGAGIVLVNHPGYFRRNLLYRAALRTALGPWEDRRESSAFVPMKKRHNYVCGGMFWGAAAAFLEMSQTLSTAIRRDMSEGIVAKHNDESHLNRWYQDHGDECVVLPPRWVYDATYSHLRDLSPIALAVRKPDSFQIAKS